MKVDIHGFSSLTGNPEAILSLMRSARLFDAGLTAEEYIRTVQQTAWRCYGLGLQVEGETPAERAESLLREMHKAGMITITEEE